MIRNGFWHDLAQVDLVRPTQQHDEKWKQRKIMKRVFFNVLAQANPDCLGTVDTA